MAAFSNRAKVIRKKDGSVLIADCAMALTSWEKMLGLLPRKSIDKNEAMWINNSTSIHTFFMKFAIDVAFIDRKGKILAIYHSLQPWRHSWIHLFAKGALEAKSGLMKEMGIEKGEILEICRSN